MSRVICFAISLTVALTSMPGIVSAQKQREKAQEVANRALSELAAWKTWCARKYLENQQEKFGSTPEFQTAWALLEIQEGTADENAMVESGTAGLSKMSRNKNVDAIASYYYGEVLYQQDKRNQANSAWQAAAASASALVEKDPTDATAQFYLGAALVRNKRFEEAREALRLAARGGFNEAMVNYQIGLSYLFAESWSEAKEAFDLGLAVEPRFAPMYFWRAMAEDKLGHKDKMLIDLDQYVKLAPNGPEAGKARAVLKSAGR